MNDIDFSGSFDEWTSTLPSYQRELLVQMRGALKDEDALVDSWLNAAVAPDTFGYGGGAAMSLYAEHFKNHVHDLLCSQQDEFVEQRQSVLADAGLGKVSLVAAITQILSPLLSAAPPLIAPAVAVTLYLIGKTGLQTWCSVQTERRNAAGHSSGSPSAGPVT